jgi:phage-related protein (TIGR01555 family)
MILDQNGEVIKNTKIPVDMKNLNPFEKNIVNSLTELTGFLGIGNYPSAPVSSTNTLYYNTRAAMISNNRTILSYMYVEHGICQTLVDQPVDDGFRSGFEIKSSQLDTQNIEDLQIFCEQERVIDSIMQAIKWSRLYGGGAIIVATDQDPSTPLNYNAITKDSKLAFIPADLWELSFGIQNMVDPGLLLLRPSILQPTYNYYGVVLDSSRVMPIRGKQAPSFLRPRFLGWGMSEYERLVRSINQYLKNQDVIFELLDEAKVDVYKIKGFTEALMTTGGTAKVAQRIQQANMLKNYNNALTMSSDDDYDQKQIAFTGLGEMLEQIRYQIACDVKMPVTKLFGMSAAGFSSGEDDLENYNSMIESEVRSKSKYIIVNALKLCCKKLFDVVPDDIQITWKPLRILTAEQEENVKEKKFNRVMQAFQTGLCTDEEAKMSINKDSLLPIEIDESIEATLELQEDNFATEEEE